MSQRATEHKRRARENKEREMAVDGKKIEMVAKSKKRGEKWVREALPALVEVTREVKWKEEEMKKETEELKEIIKTVEEPYKKEIEMLKEMGEMLRGRVMEEYEETEAIKEEGVGELVFPSVQSIEITDINKVDRKYLMVNLAKIKEDVKKGVSKIKGVEISKKRTLQVRQWKE